MERNPMTRSRAMPSPRWIIPFALAAMVTTVVTLGESFFARERLSPPASFETTIGSGSLRVAFGQPSARGRVVFGELVPYGVVWRTGANEATTLETDIDLRFGDTLVPKGTYSLFTIPQEEQWTLVINRQTGQWGTIYDPARDLVRVPMRIEPLSEHVERLTFRFEEGELLIEWSRTRARLAVSATS